MTVRTVVFDMDGTLVQTRKASWEIFQDTARRFDLPVRTAEDFFALFENNFFESLGRLIPDPDLAAQVRTHFMTGLKERYQPDFVPGMVDVIKALAPHYALAVMSSNSMDAIRRILEVADVAQCFAHVFSAEVGTSKREHLQRVQLDPAYGGVRQCSPAYVEADPGQPPTCAGAAEVVLITDTIGDVEEATSCGTRPIGVAWGMHSVQALRDAGAERVVYWPQELVAILLPDGTAPATSGSCAIRTAGGSGGCAVAPRPPVPKTTPRPSTGPTPTGPTPTDRSRPEQTTSTRDPAAISAVVEQLGRLRHSRRTAAVADVMSPCRCGKRCGLDDATHGCGRQRPTDAAVPTSARPTVAVHANLVTAIARIARPAP